MQNRDSNTPFSVLHLEVSEVDSQSIRNQLEKVRTHVCWKRVSSRDEFLEALPQSRWNLVLSDEAIAGLGALEAMKLLHLSQPEVPFLLVASPLGEESVADFMKSGVEDFVLKGRPERFELVLRRLLREHDVKEKEQRAHRMASEAFAAREQMLAIVSHDIKNPLSAISLEAEMLLKVADRNPKTLLGEEVRIQANRILKTTDRLKLLISDLLDNSKNENSLASLSRSDVDLKRLVFDVVDSVRPHIQQKEILFRTSLLPQVRTLNVDRTKMFQVFSNLINNSIKFTPVGGTIEFSMEDHEDDYIFCVKDTGPGLLEPDIGKVFEKYWTGGSAGTGLGLFICKTIVEAHGGHIMAENSDSSGARFWFNLPKSQSAHRPSTEPLFHHGRRSQRKRILIIDDDEDLREVIAWALTKEGYLVQSFHDPHEALARLKKSRHPPHLIIVDYHLEGMRGDEFLALKNDITGKQVQDCPVVMISASPQEVERDVSRHLYRDVISKPIDLEGLIGKIKRYAGGNECPRPELST